MERREHEDTGCYDVDVNSAMPDKGGSTDWGSDLKSVDLYKCCNSISVLLMTESLIKHCIEIMHLLVYSVKVV